MPTDVDPIAGNWYCHLDKGQRFLVVAAVSYTHLTLPTKRIV